MKILPASPAAGPAHIALELVFAFAGKIDALLHVRMLVQREYDMCRRIVRLKPS